MEFRNLHRDSEWTWRYSRPNANVCASLTPHTACAPPNGPFLFLFVPFYQTGLSIHGPLWPRPCQFYARKIFEWRFSRFITLHLLTLGQSAISACVALDAATCKLALPLPLAIPLQNFDISLLWLTYVIFSLSANLPICSDTHAELSICTSYGLIWTIWDIYSIWSSRVTASTFLEAVLIHTCASSFRSSETSVLGPYRCFALLSALISRLSPWHSLIFRCLVHESTSWSFRRILCGRKALKDHHPH